MLTAGVSLLLLFCHLASTWSCWSILFSFIVLILFSILKRAPQSLDGDINKPGLRILLHELEHIVSVSLTLSIFLFLIILLSQCRVCVHTDGGKCREMTALGPSSTDFWMLNFLGVMVHVFNPSV